MPLRSWPRPTAASILSPWTCTAATGWHAACDVCGMAWGGDDPDFWPTFLAYGPGRGKVNDWDFTEAVRFWTDSKHANHGFMLHGDSHGYITAWSRARMGAAEDRMDRRQPRMTPNVERRTNFKGEVQEQ